MKKNLLNFYFSGVFSFIVCWFILFFLSNYGEFKSHYYVIIVALWFCLFMLSFAVLLDSYSPILLMFFLYMTLFYVAPGLVHAHFDYFPFYQPFYSRADISEAGFLILIFCILVVSGYFFADKFLVKTTNNNTDFRQTEEVSESIAVLFIIFCGVLSVALGLLVGVDYINQPRRIEDAISKSDPVNMIIESLCRVTGFFCILYTFIFYKKFSGFLRFAVIIFSAAIFVFSNNPAAVPRFVMASYFLTIYYVFFKSNIKNKIKFVLVFAVLQVSVFPLMSQLSRGDISNMVNMDPAEYIIGSGDFDGLQSTISAVSMVNSTGINYGNNFASAVFFFVPRSIWSEKSYGTGVDAADYMGFNFKNLSAPLPAEFFVDFYWPGVILLSFCVGIFFCWFDRSYEFYFNSNKKIKLIIFSIFIGYIFIVLRGSLVAVLGPVSVSVLLAILIEKFFSRIQQ